MPGSADILVAIVDDDRAVLDLETYFALGSPTASGSRFTGGRFERLGGGGGHAQTKDRFVADDLIAVTLLSVQVPPPIAIQILEGDLGRDLSAQLRLISTDIAIGAEGADRLLDNGGPANKAWGLLKACDGVGWVTAGKLLARKRPKLIPVYDHVVQCVRRSPDSFWLWLHRHLADEETGLRAALHRLRRRANVPADISDLRILDVAVWMRHRNDHVPWGVRRRRARIAAARCSRRVSQASTGQESPGNRSKPRFRSRSEARSSPLKILTEGTSPGCRIAEPVAA